MVVFPNCKINLGLHITAKRADGYHNIETVFYPIPFHDVLEVILAEEKLLLFSTSGEILDADDTNNLCIKAYQLLQRDFSHLPAIKMHLHKAIPAGAGLGGGSADAAFTLQLLNSKYSLGLSKQQLLSYALQLGSDCPFFVYNTPCIATGRGEILEPVAIDLSNYNLLLVNPKIHIPTARAYADCKPTKPSIPLIEIIHQPVETWKDNLRNDFESSVFKQHSEIENIKNKLYEKGAVYASMSGSGSTVYGLYKTEIPAIEFPAHYFLKRITSLSVTPSPF